MSEDTRSHVRLAVAKNGDDVTFSRYVKAGNRGHKPPPRRNARLPGFENDAQKEGRTYFRKTVKAAEEMKTLLVSGHSNVKIGRDVRKGKLAGYWIYTLSFEERATCPRSCHHWQTCYGNNMPYAKRIDHTDPALYARLEEELAELLAIRGRPGVLVRLHALGDFFSEDYVDFWDRMLHRHERLVIFGYTAWTLETPIGRAVARLHNHYPQRAMVRVSNGGMPIGSTVPIMEPEQCPPDAFVCPEQTGKVEACGKCGVCWSTMKNVAFLEH